MRKSSKYIEWLSLIRTVGLILVLVYHLLKKLLPGGFLGVDVFFTLSGFLVCANFIRDNNRNRFSLYRFLNRRFWRIMPPLLVSIALTLPLTLLISPDIRVGLGKQIAAAIGFTTNYFEIYNGLGYEARIFPRLYVHTWSLAVEVQFYVLWGLLALVVSRMTMKNEKGRRTFKLLMGLFAFTIGVLSYLFMQNGFLINADDPSPAYYDSASHIFPFMVGAFIACLPGFEVDIRTGEKKETETKSKRYFAAPLCMLISVLGLFGLSHMTTFYNALTYRYGFLLSAGLTAAMIYAAKSFSKVEKEPKILKIISDLSYGVYLFHWPCYIIFSQLMTNEYAIAAVTVAFAFAGAVISVYIIEPTILRFRRVRMRFKYNIRRVILADICWIALFTVLLFDVIAVGCAPAMTSQEANMNAEYVRQSMDEVKHAQRFKNNPSDGHANSVINTEYEQAQGDVFANDANQANEILPKDSDNANEPQVSAQNGQEGSAPKADETLVLGAGVKDEQAAVAPENALPEGVTVIGDSVTVGARSTIQDQILDSYVDAAGNRTLPAGYKIFKQMQEDGTLSAYVVIALGANIHRDWQEAIDNIINDLEPGYRLIFLTPYDGRTPNEGIANDTCEYERSLVDTYTYVTVADWADAIKDNEKYLTPDKVHCNSNAARQIYTDVIKEAISEASGKAAKE